MNRHHRYRQSKNKCEGFSCSIAIVAVICASSALALVICGFVYARPGLPALSFKETLCEVQYYKPVEERTCKCSGSTNDNQNCESSFLCIHVFVRYNITSNNGTSKVLGIIHEHESVAYSIHNDCSMYTCEQSKKANGLKVNRFLKDYGKTGEEYICYYDRNLPTRVIISRRYTLQIILISLLIPACVFVVSFLVVIILCVAARSRKQEKLEPLSTNRNYMNYTVTDDNGMPIRANSRPATLSRPDDNNQTYMRQEDPRPPIRASSQSTV